MAHNERPILFSGPMVRALLEGRKTQTRRIAKVVAENGQVPARILRGHEVRGGPHSQNDCVAEYDGGGTIQPGNRWQQHAIGCPYGQPGDRLWVRETWSPDHRDVYPCPTFIYRADGLVSERDVTDHVAACTQEKRDRGQRHGECLACAGFRWRPSIHMPRKASRLTLEVVSVRVERLHDISEEDAREEGAELDNGHPERGAFLGVGPCHREGFAQLWADINGTESWAANPFVWVVSFTAVTP